MRPVEGEFEGSFTGSATVEGAAEEVAAGGFDVGVEVIDADEVEELEVMDDGEVEEVDEGDVDDVEIDEVDDVKPIVVMAVGVPGSDINTLLVKDCSQQHT
jgi:hypothetical protein